MNDKTKTIVLAISNQKGGVGKTCSTAAISGILSRKGKNVLMIDLDGQGNLSNTFLTKIPVETIADTFNDGKLPIVKVKNNLDIIPCNSNISLVAQAMDQPSDRLILKTNLSKIKGKYDFIVIDCPPAFNYITNNAYTAADFVLVPTQATPNCIDALKQIAEACYAAATPTRIDGIFLTMYDSHPKIVQKMENLIREKYGSTVFKTQIRKSVKIDEATDNKTDVVDYCPSCNPAQDYFTLVDEILNLVEA